MALNIVFMGTPDFSVAALQTIIDSEHNVICVYSQPPRPKGRGHKVQKSPVHELAEKHGIEVKTPQSFKKNEQACNDFVALNADIAVVAAYGLILPKIILDAPRMGSINIHASLLPKWRGAAPIQKSIWEGDHKTGITLMKMDIGLDTGDMLVKKEIAITAKTTAMSLHDDLSAIGADMIIKLLDMCDITGMPEGEKQDDNLSSYASMLKKEDGKIDWNDSSDQIDRQIRALTPWPSCFCINNEGKRLKIIEARISDIETNHEAGILIDKEGHVSCGDGKSICLIIVQPENSKKMNISSAINGKYISIGKKL